MNLLAAIPYLFEGRMRELESKPVQRGDISIYATAEGEFIQFSKEDGTPCVIKAIMGTDFGDLGNPLWEPHFYENQPEVEREEITASTRYRSYSLLSGVEKLFNGEAVRLRSGDEYLAIIEWDEWTRELAHGRIIEGVAIRDDEEYMLSRSDLAKEWISEELIEEEVGLHGRD